MDVGGLYGIRYVKLLFTLLHFAEVSII